VTVQIAPMFEPDTMISKCPNCDARYKVVRVEADQTQKFREITCKSCGGPLQGRDGKLIFKYFLIGNRKRGLSGRPPR